MRVARRVILARSLFLLAAVMIATPAGAMSAWSPFPKDPTNPDFGEDPLGGGSGGSTTWPELDPGVPEDAVPWASVEEAEDTADGANEEAERQADDLARQLDDASSSAHDAARGVLRSLRNESGSDPAMTYDEPSAEAPAYVRWAPDPQGLDPRNQDALPSKSCESDPTGLLRDVPGEAENRFGSDEPPAPHGIDCADSPPNDAGRVHRESRLEDRAANPELGAVILWVLLGTGTAYVLAHVAWSLHSRVPPERLLRHPRRRLIANALEANPGMEVATLARSAGLSRGVARYHLAILSRAGLVWFVQVGGRTAVFRTGSAARTAGALQAVLLRRTPVQRLYALLQTDPHLDQTIIAQRLGMTQQRVSFLLGRMREAALVDASSDGRRATYAARPPLHSNPPGRGAFSPGP